MTISDIFAALTAPKQAQSVGNISTAAQALNRPENRTSTDLLGPTTLAQGQTPFQVRARSGRETQPLPVPQISPATQVAAALQKGIAEPTLQPMVYGIPRYLMSMMVAGRSLYDPKGAGQMADEWAPKLQLQNANQLTGGSSPLTQVPTAWGLASGAAAQLSTLDLLRRLGGSAVSNASNLLNNRGSFNPNATVVNPNSPPGTQTTLDQALYKAHNVQPPSLSPLDQLGRSTAPTQEMLQQVTTRLPVTFEIEKIVNSIGPGGPTPQQAQALKGIYDLLKSTDPGQLNQVIPVLQALGIPF